jgi:hypothetical protein
VLKKMRTEELAGADSDCSASNKPMEVQMNPKSSTLSVLGLTLVGSLGLGVGSASAQSAYVETYAEPFPIVEPYPVVVGPRYVVQPAVVAAPPVVRERVIVSRPGYVPAPVLGPPVPPSYVVADW